MPRPCACPHGYPVCACAEGHTGQALLARSRWLSSLAGYPAKVSDAAIAEWTPAPPPTPEPAQAHGPEPAPLPREAKPRGSLADAVRARKECIPCQQRKDQAP